MKVLLDESIPRDHLRDHLPDHDVTTVRGAGRQGKLNGEWLTLASSHFDVLITADQNLPHQQNLAGFDIGVVVLVAQRNRLLEYLPLLPVLRAGLAGVQPGEAIRVAL